MRKRLWNAGSRAIYAPAWCVWRQAYASATVTSVLVNTGSSRSCWPSWATIWAPIGSAEVAAGEGALHTCRLRRLWRNRKSSISWPASDTAWAQVGLEHLEDAGVAEHAGAVGQGNIALAVALALERQHGVGADGDAAVDHSGQVHAEERHARVGDRVGQGVDDVVVAGRQAEVFATERADAEARIDAQHAHHAVGHQPGAGEQEAAGKVAGAGFHAYFLLALLQRSDAGTVADLAAGVDELAGHGRSHFGVIDDAAGGHKDAAKALDVRLAFTQLLGIQPFALNAVGRGALPQRLHALHFQVVGGHQ